MPKHETRNILLNTWEVMNFGNEIWTVYVILQNNFFHQNIL